jgi:hypothetical protein
MFTESLTVRILGDSTDLQDELGSIAEQIEGLQDELSSVTSAGAEIGEGLGRAAVAVAPLTQVSTLLTGIGRQAEQLSQQSISFNVQPALAGLRELSAMLQAVSAQSAALSGGVGFAGGAAGEPALPRLVGGAPAFATGGLVDGPNGLDATPAWLTAGEFVMSRDATQRLGTTFLTALNAGGSPAVNAAARTPMPTPSELTTNNHFGGISIHVTEAVEINDVIRDLRFEGATLRNRRG